LFAAVYAGAAQAIDYGVLPWGKKATLSAIRTCMIDAMEKLITSSADGRENDRGSMQSERSMLADFKRRLDGATFARLERDRRKKKVLATRLTTADGVIPPHQAAQVRISAVRSNHEGVVPRSLGSATAHQAAALPSNPQRGPPRRHQHQAGVDRRARHQGPVLRAGTQPAEIIIVLLREVRCRTLPRAPRVQE
jgi:hypothetical protein